MYLLQIFNIECKEYSVFSRNYVYTLYIEYTEAAT